MFYPLLPQAFPVFSCFLFGFQEVFLVLEIKAAIDCGQAVFHQQTIQQAPIREVNVGQQASVIVPLVSCGLQSDDLLSGKLDIEVRRFGSNPSQGTFSYASFSVIGILWGVFHLGGVDADQPNLADFFHPDGVAVVYPLDLS